VWRNPKGGADKILDYLEGVHVFIRRTIRAVKLYIKLGKRLSATLRKLGYPTKNSLISWYREYELEQDLQVSYSRTSGKYSAEQKQIAVQHYLDHDQCISANLRALGYPCRDAANCGQR